MARAEPVGYFLLYVMCFGFEQFQHDNKLQKLAETMLLKVQTLSDFIENYCMQRVVLRLEEVVTLDVTCFFKETETSELNLNTRAVFTKTN